MFCSGDTRFESAWRWDKRQLEVRAMSAEYPNDVNMTMEQKTQVQKLAVDKQVSSVNNHISYSVKLRLSLLKLECGAGVELFWV